RGGGGGLKPDAEEDHFSSRVLLRQLHRIQRRIDHPHPPAGGLEGEQIGRAARHAEHVAERAEDHFGPGGDLQRFVDEFNGRDTDRAAGAVNERNLLGQQLVDAELDDGVGLAAAHFHEGPGPRRDARYLPRKLVRGIGIAVFVQIFHRTGEVVAAGGTPGLRDATLVPLSSSSVNSCISRRYSKTWWASASSTRLSAKPTCTMT